MAHLELIEICKGFNEPVLDRLSFSVEKGEFFVVVGPSGIGKTTLLRCVAGLETLDGGRIMLDGQDVTREPPYRRKTAMTFESYALYPHLTVFENIASPLIAHKTDPATIRRRVQEVTTLLRIDHLLDRKPHEISGGQKQRTALGRTLIAKPKVFLLDEPISHLDAKIRAELRLQFHTLEELREVATIYVTHDYAEALSLGDRIGVMGNGGLVQIGTAHEVFLNPSSLFVARHLGQPSINEVSAELVQESGMLQVALGALKFPVAGKHAAVLQSRNQPQVTLGIRPQHIRPGTTLKSTDSTTLSAKVEVFEALGAYGVMRANLSGTSLTLLTDSESHYSAGEDVSLTLDPSEFFYFHPETGSNLMLGA